MIIDSYKFGGAPPPSGISLIGTPLIGTSANGDNIVLDLTTIGATILEDDVVVVFGGHAQRSAGTPSIDTSGYTAFLTPIDTTSAGYKLGAWWKKMTSTPDTQVDCGIGGGAQQGNAFCCFVLRGVHSTPSDATPTSANNTTGSPDSPSITTNTNGAWVFSVGCCHISGAFDNEITGGPSTYSGFITAFQSETYSISLGAAYKEIATAGAENPGAFTSAGGDDWIGISIAIKPA